MNPADDGLPEPGLLRRYLRASGWTSSALKVSELKLFSKQEAGFDPIEVVVPETMAAPQAERRVRQALDTLSDIYEQSVSEVAAAVNGIGQDTIREHVPDGFRNSIRLPAAEAIVTRNRRLLEAAAHAEFARTGSAGQGAVESYVENCRFGHTFRGSFGFTIHSPVGPRPLDDLTDEQPPSPPERQIVQRVMRGLATVAHDVDSEAARVLADPAIGFDANMLESLAALLKGSRASELTFDFLLSREWRPADDLSQESSFAIDVSKAELLLDVASDLRKSTIPTESLITGYVTKLATRENPADLENLKGSYEVTVDWATGRKPLPVRVLLSPADYRIALRSHEHHTLVTVEGTIESAGRGYIIRRAKITGI